jgi:ubiquinone/menaquinone biosynthesis C-methylase UbiE
MPFDHFNIIAGIYDRSGQFSVSGLLLEQLSLSQDTSLVDVGGGTGRVSAVLRDMVRNAFVMDTSLGMLRFAARKGLATACAQAESMPFPSKWVDRVFMMDALHHVLNQKQTIQELWRVLKPSGRIVIVEPDIHLFTVKLLALGEKVLLMRSHFLSSEKIIAQFGGFKTNISIFHEGINVIVVIEKRMDNN